MTNPIKTLWSEGDIRALIREELARKCDLGQRHIGSCGALDCWARPENQIVITPRAAEDIRKIAREEAVDEKSGPPPPEWREFTVAIVREELAKQSQPAEAKLWPPLREPDEDDLFCFHKDHPDEGQCWWVDPDGDGHEARCAAHPPKGYTLRQPAAEQPAPTHGREATESELLGIASVWFGETGYATSTIHADKARRVIAAVRKIGLGCDCAERIEDLTGSLACEILRAEQAEAELAKLREATIKPAPVTCAECGDVGYRVMCQKCEPYWKNVPGSCDGSHVEIIAQSAETAELLEARIAKLERQLAEAPTHGREATVARLEEILESWHEAARECFPDADEEELMVDFIRRQHRELESERRVGDENKRRLFEIYAVADSVVAPKSENVTKLIPRLHHELTTMRNLVNRATSILNRTAGEAVREWMRDARKALEVKP